MRLPKFYYNRARLFLAWLGLSMLAYSIAWVISVLK